jgi:alpha/beta superfamily hydrolase
VPRQEERSVAIALPDAAGLALEGLFVAGHADDPRGALIAAPHPLHGGSMDVPVVCELAFGCAQAGVASLRFNWRGVGASAGEPSGEAELADADFRAALGHLAESVEGEIVGCGYSFGAAAALRTASRDPRVRRLLLVAPPPVLLDRATLERFQGPLLVIVGERDTLAPPAVLEGWLPEHPGARFERVPGADHFFSRGLSEISRLTRGWLEGSL